MLPTRYKEMAEMALSLYHAGKIASRRGLENGSGGALISAPLALRERIWWLECPGSVPGINSGRPRDTRDVSADLCGNSNSRGRMSAGQTGQMTGQTGFVH